MRDVNEKYVRINIDFPNKAGKLAQVLATQKRLALLISKQKISPEVKELLVSVAEGYDVANDLMEWMKATIQGVANDSEQLLEGSSVRNLNKLIIEENEMLWGHFLNR